MEGVQGLPLEPVCQVAQKEEINLFDEMEHMPTCRKRIFHQTTFAIKSCTTRPPDTDVAYPDRASAEGGQTCAIWHVLRMVHVCCSIIANLYGFQVELNEVLCIREWDNPS
jgi:hypothetical protein